MKRELVVILPAYNEAENIERLVDRLESQADPLNAVSYTHLTLPTNREV